MVKLSVCLPTYSGASAFTDEIDYQELENFALTAERLGYTTAFAPDHFMSGAEGGQFEVWMFLSALAQTTSRIRIGALVLEPAHRNPAFVAKMAGTLDYLSGGRLDLGIGNGRFRTEEEAYGFGWVDSGKERLERLTEAILVMKSLFTNPRSSFAGTYYQLIDATCEPSPLQKPWPRLWIDGDNDSLELVAEHADSWHISAVSPGEYAQKLRALEDQCSKIGRNFNDIEKTMGTMAIIVKDDSDTDRLVDWIMTQHNGEADRPRNRSQAIKLLNRKYIVGSADKCFQQIQEYTAAGVEHLAINFLDYPRTDTMETIARKFLPGEEK